MKYTPAMLKQAVRSSSTFVEVLEKLGVNSKSGGMHKHLSMRVRRLGIDTTHLIGKGHWKGKRRNSRLKPKEVLVRRRDGYRTKGRYLRQALIEIGRAYKCKVCGQGPRWKGKPLVLEVDHKSRDWQDNRPGNLRFLCPNCHAQVE